MAYTLLILTIISTQFQNVVNEELYRCILNDGAKISAYEAALRSMEGHTTIGVSVTTEDNEEPDATDDCKSYVTLHGDQGTSQPNLLNLIKRPHCIIDTAPLGKLLFATVAQRELTQGAECAWWPRLHISKSIFNSTSEYPCSVEKTEYLHRTRRSITRNLKIRVKTSTAYLAGTDANIYITIYGKSRSSGEHSLHGSFERGDIDETQIRVNDIGIIYQVRVRRDNRGLNSDWKLDWIIIEEHNQRGLELHCNCWTKSPQTITVDNECSGITNCRSQLCDTCHSCDSPDSTYFYIPTNNNKKCTRCSWIENCDKGTHDCFTCNKCIESGAAPEYSIFWLTADKKKCNPTCSWKNQWCWPGQCAAPNYWTSDCACEDGFKKADSSAKCDISIKPDLVTCKSGMEDSMGNMENSTSLGSSTSCNTESDTYVNIVPVAMSFKIFAHFEKKITSPKRSFIGDTRLGIVDGRILLTRKSVKGTNESLSTIPLLGGGHCDTVISSTSPNQQLDCNKNVPVTNNLENGDWICMEFEISSGGSFTFTDFGGKHVGTQHFSPVTADKTLCFRYDTVSPVHCAATGSCEEDPLRLSTRVTKSANISISVGGWIDPYPHQGRPDQASGVDFYKLQVYGVKHLGLNELTVDYALCVFESHKLKGSHHSVTVTLPDQPAMYSVYLEVHDVAGNVRFSRRFLLFDNTSTLEVREDKHLWAVSASKDTNYIWQTHHGKIRLTWMNRYHNDYYIHNDYFVPIKADTGNGIVDVYEQYTGLLPVTGTESINGVTCFKFRWALNNGSRTAWNQVPDFTKQSLSLHLNLTDGETYEVWILAHDIMFNTIVESVVVHIDESVASISNTWLVREGTSQIYVHNNTDLSKMVVQFCAFDVHSGITTVLWALGTSYTASDLGTGALPIVKLGKQEICPTDGSCYCPSVGECEYQNYTLTLNSLVANDTHMGQHNRKYYFTLYITNGAKLKSFDHLDVLVDESAPEGGVVQEGTAGGPDVDYTSEENVVISWGGFVDHESGIREYIVGLANRCLTVEELKEGNVSEALIEHTKLETISVTFPTKGKYFTSITALNNALEPSVVVCSDGIIFDISPPIIENISLHQATVKSSLQCIDNHVWLINFNLTMSELPLTSSCLDKCTAYTSDNNLRFPTVHAAHINNETADSFCRELPNLNNTVIYIPFDKLLLNWSISETESQIRDSFIGFGMDKSRHDSPDLADYELTHGKTEFRLYRAGFGGSTKFFIFIKVENKAGLSSTATLGPVLIDDTPPIVHQQLKPEIVGNQVRVAWEKGSISDPEQTDQQFTVTYRAVIDHKYVTPVLETPQAMRMACQSLGFADCIQHPLNILQRQDSELGKACLFELYVYNSAGQYTTVRTKSIWLPSIFPPGPATVFDLDPANIGNMVDVDFHQNKTACVHWYGFHHHKNVTLEIGIGSAKGLDDVEPFQYFNRTGAQTTCMPSVSLEPFTRYFTSIRASCSGGRSVSSSDGFVIIKEYNDALVVNDGLGCDPNDKYLIRKTDVTTSMDRSNLSLEVPLHVGYSYSLITYNITNFDGFTLQSDDIVIQDTVTESSVYHVTFFPLLTSPLLTLSSLDKLNLTIDLTTCVSDYAYQTSTATYAMNWIIGKQYLVFVTNFKLELFEKSFSGSSHESSLSIVQEFMGNAGNYTSFSFTNLHLDPGATYVASFTPCFENICLPRQQSTGLQVVSKPIIGKFTSTIEHETRDCIEVSLEVSDAECNTLGPISNTSLIAQWAILKTNTDDSPMTTWTRLDIASSKVSVCEKLPIHTYQRLFSCVRVFCPSGLFGKKCVELTPNPNVESYSDHMLFELPADDSRLMDVKDLLHSRYLGTRLRLLHEMDLDFVNISSRMSAVITNSNGHNITWYMMRGQSRLPRIDCNSDMYCVTSKTSHNGYIRFGKVAFDESEPYYICANVTASSKSPGFTVCGNGFIADNTPPIAGSVSISNVLSGFITDASHIIIKWSGFRDNIPSRGTWNANGIKFFSVAIGNYHHGNNIYPWTRVGDSTTYVAHGLPLQNGEEYYATVRAEDHIGHVTFSVSPGVVADLTPPLCGDIHIEGLLPHRNAMTASSLHVHLKDIHDPESSIQSIHLSVLTSANTDSSHLHLGPGTTFANIRIDDSFVDGHSYQTKVQVTNNAGLHSTCASRSFILDNSPPQAGVVRDGAPNSEAEVDHQTDSTLLECHWSGFSDPHSGIQHYRVGHGTSPDTQDVQSLQSVGHANNHTFEWTFVPGVTYYCIVEACNDARLCTTVSSDGIIMDGSSPVAGVVIIGHTDTHDKYHGHRSYVYSHWVGFEDAETGIHHFESCIGLSTGCCDVTNFTNTALSDYYFATGLNLPLSVPLFVTVRAYNPVGLFVEATSPSFIVDDTPPLVIEQPVFISTSSDGARNITAQWDNSLLHVAWKFLDSESPIHEHVLTFRTHHESSVAIETIKLGPQQSYLLVLKKDNRLRNGDKYQVSVSSCNRAGLCSTSHSPDILIDSTPPLLGGFKPPLNWKTSHMSGSTITNVTLTWYGFSDAESNISHYQISVGRSYEGAELTDGTVLADHDENFKEQSVTLQLLESLSNGDNIVLSIWAVNSLSLPSSVGKVTVSVVNTNHVQGMLEIQRHSCDVHYCTKDCTCAVVGWKCRPPPQPMVCRDIVNSTKLPEVMVHPGTSKQAHISVIPSLSCITGHWELTVTSSYKPKRYEWSMGLKGEPIGSGIFNLTEENIWYDVGSKTEIVHCLPYDHALEHGEDYVIYVRAWFTDTDYSVFTSQNIRVDHSPPAVRRSWVLKDSDNSCKKDFDVFHSNQSIVTSCWQGLFQETQSSITEFFIWAGVTRYGTDLLPEQSVGLSTNITLPVDDILPGTKYYVGVRAVNTLNMSTTVISDGFLLDGDQPLGGHVFNTEHHRNILAQSENTSIGVSWNGFQDHHSSVRRYLIQVKEDNSSDTIVEVNTILRNTLRVDGLLMEHGKRYVTAVTAEDFAGHIGETILSQPITIDTTPPNGFVCQIFSEISPINISFECLNDVASFVLNHFSIDLPDDVGSHFRVRISTLANLLDNEMALFTLGRIYAQIPFVLQQNHTVYSAEYQFTFRGDSSRNIEIIVRSKTSFDNANVTVESCSSKEFTSGPAAVTVKQLLPSLVSISARLDDPESGLRNILIGAGTTRDGYQIQTLRSAVGRFYEVIEVDIPHGTPFYTTVIAENHAGLRTYFLSDPIIIDHTPPLLKDIKTSLKYFYTNSRDSIEVQIDASWISKDEESQVADCWCSLGRYHLGSDLHGWVPSQSRSSCQLLVPDVTHGLRFYLTVQCSNNVEMQTVASSGKLVILFQPPSAVSSVVDIVVQNKYRQHSGDAVQSSKSSLKFQWEWPDSQAVSHYQCRVEGLGMTDWVNTSLRYCEFSELLLKDGGRYIAQVRAVDVRDQTSATVSEAVIVDSTAPKLTGTKASVQWQSETFTIHYGSVFYHISGQLTYTISVGSSYGYSDYLHQLVTHHSYVTVKLPVSSSETHLVIVAKAPVGTEVTYTDMFSK